jgi:hypothetical protein
VSQIKLRYVQAYRDCRGKLRHYVRQRGKPNVPLPGPPGSPQFMEAYQSAIASDGHAPTTARHKEGTIGYLVTRFYRSAAYTNLAPSSQKAYRLILDKFSREDGHRLVRDMPKAVASSIIEEIGATRPGMANLTAATLKRLFSYAVKMDMRPDNPFVGIDAYEGGEHRAWTDREILALGAVADRDTTASGLRSLAVHRPACRRRRCDAPGRFPQRCHSRPAGKDPRRPVTAGAPQPAAVTAGLPGGRSGAIEHPWSPHDEAEHCGHCCPRRSRGWSTAGLPHPRASESRLDATRPARRHDPRDTGCRRSQVATGGCALYRLRGSVPLGAHSDRPVAEQTNRRDQCLTSPILVSNNVLVSNNARRNACLLADRRGTG